METTTETYSEESVSPEDAIRELVTIQRVGEIKPIYTQDGDPADSIEQITVMGWRLVAEKGLYKEGDLCVFFEIDSLLPQQEEWTKKYAAFMKKSKWRVKTLKLNRMRVDNKEGKRVPVISQGLALPLDALSAAMSSPLMKAFHAIAVKEGDDVTEIMGVEKYEVPTSTFAGHSKGSFPDWISKTDEPRIQSNTRLLYAMAGKPYYITQKLDGTSVTIWWDAEDGLHVASRNSERGEGSLYWEVAEKYTDAFVTHPDVAIQGEIVGPAIQGNPAGYSVQRIFVFNAFDRKTGEYYDYENLISLCKEMGMDMVPLIAEGDSFDYTDIDVLLELAQGNYPNGHAQEGIVIRPKAYEFDDRLYRMLSFKVVNNDYL